MTSIKKRDEFLQGKTYAIETGVGSAWITINDDADGPFETFINISKAGSDIQADAEAIGRLISLIFRMPNNLSQHDRAREIIGQLSDIGGSRVLEDVRSMPDGIAKAMRMHISSLDE